MAHASGLFESNLHKVSFVGGFREHRAGPRQIDTEISRSIKSRRWSPAAAAKISPGSRSAVGLVPLYRACNIGVPPGNGDDQGFRAGAGRAAHHDPENTQTSGDPSA
jgi:hypothetical protein